MLAERTHAKIMVFVTLHGTIIVANVPKVTVAEIVLKKSIAFGILVPRVVTVYP